MSEDGGSVKALGPGRHGLRLPAHHQQDPGSFSQVQGRQVRRHPDQLHAFRSCGLADIVADIRKFASAGKKTAVVSTINGDANVPFYKELANQGIKADDIPVVAFSVGEEELAGIDTSNLVGHLAAWNYFQSVDAAENESFIKKWHAYIKDTKARDQRSHGSHRHRLPHVDPGGETGGHGGGGRGAAGHVRAGGQVPERLRHRDEHQPPPLEAGHDRRDPAGRTVPRSSGRPRAPSRPMPGAPSYRRAPSWTANWAYPWVCGNCEKPKYTN